METDTIKLLQECDAGTKMAVSSIDEVVSMVQNPEMKHLLEESRAHHTKLGNEIHEQLLQHGSEDKEPNPIAKGMSWMKTNWKMGVKESDATAADLITDGCNMGVKSLHKYLNQYPAADGTAKHLCEELVGEEAHLANHLQSYL